jgi:hypothetical protein
MSDGFDIFPVRLLLVRAGVVLLGDTRKVSPGATTTTFMI